ncbi:hypothetical protein ACQZ5D_03430 [Agrobacterium sp. 22-211-1]
MEKTLTFQDGVAQWLLECFGPAIAADKTERADRFIEEALELVQSVGYPAERIIALIGYVYARPIGEPVQETGGVMVTLASFCLVHGINLNEAAQLELARVWTKIDAIRAKHASKPTGSALPGGAPSSLNLRECIVSVLRDSPEVRNIGGLADRLEISVLAWANATNAETVGAL